MDWVSVGGRIRAQREFLGFTREVFAEKLDVTPKFCSDIELGLKGMSVNTLCKISDTLGLTVDYILFGSGGEGKSGASMFLEKCPQEKLPYLEEIIKAFILSIDTK